MRQFKMKHSAVTAATLLMLGAISAAHAETTICSGTIGAKSLDNIVVQDGATCVLKDTRLKGSINVQTRATLNASRVRVNGNIQSEGSKAVTVNPGSVVGGNIQIK
jgi:hypothetical protein